MVKFLLQSNWENTGTNISEPQTSTSAPNESSLTSSSEQQDKEQEQEPTTEERKEEVLLIEQEDIKDEVEEEKQETGTFSKLHAVQQALVAAASMGHTEVFIFNKRMLIPVP